MPGGDGVSGAELSDSALVQQGLWGTDPRGWAEVAEPLNRPLFEAILDATAVGEGTRVLDVGCGSGLTLVLAAERGATVAGLDVSPGLLAVARERLPEADLRLGDLQVLPYDDAGFDVVLGVNAFQFAEDPVAALGEARRVVRPGGLVAASLFAEPERCESTAIHVAMAALSPPARQATHEPYALSAPQGLELRSPRAGSIVERRPRCPWCGDTPTRMRRCAGCSAPAAGPERSRTWAVTPSRQPSGTPYAPSRARRGQPRRGRDAQCVPLRRRASRRPDLKDRGSDTSRHIGRVVLVSGAAGGIGAAVAVRLAAEGAGGFHVQGQTLLVDGGEGHV